jgi:hypothetical protein
MKEKDIVDFGFEKVDVPVEESGDKTDYYYYKYDLSDSITLVSVASDEAKDDNWYVGGDLGYDITITEAADLYLLMHLFKRWTVNN